MSQGYITVVTVGLVGAAWVFIAAALHPVLLKWTKDPGFSELVAGFWPVAIPLFLAWTITARPVIFVGRSIGRRIAARMDRPKSIWIPTATARRKESK